MRCGEFAKIVVTDTRRVLADVLEDGSHEMNTLARLVIQRAHDQWRESDAHIAWCDERIAQHARDNADVRRATQLMGIGPVGASAAVATVDDFTQFKSMGLGSGRSFGHLLRLRGQPQVQRIGYLARVFLSSSLSLVGLLDEPA